MVASGRSGRQVYPRERSRALGLKRDIILEAFPWGRFITECGDVPW